MYIYLSVTTEVKVTLKLILRQKYVTERTGNEKSCFISHFACLRNVMSNKHFKKRLSSQSTSFISDKITASRLFFPHSFQISLKRQTSFLLVCFPIQLTCFFLSDTSSWLNIQENNKTYRELSKRPWTCAFFYPFSSHTLLSPTRFVKSCNKQ
jgi:hypothetical protein